MRLAKLNLKNSIIVIRLLAYLLYGFSMLTSCEGSKQPAEGQQLSYDGVSKRDRMIPKEKVTSTTTIVQDTLMMITEQMV